MKTNVDEDSLRKLGKKIARGIKTEADLGDFSKLPKKIVVETDLDAELTDHWVTTRTALMGMALVIAAQANPENDLKVVTVISTLIHPGIVKAHLSHSSS